MRKTKRRATMTVSELPNPKFDNSQPKCRNANPESIYRVERLTNTLAVKVGAMLTPAEVEVLFVKGIDIVVKPSKPQTGVTMSIEVPPVEAEEKPPAKKPLQWNVEGEGESKKHAALGDDTGNIYEIKPGKGKHVLTVDGKPHNGRGSVSHLQELAQKMEDNLQTSPPQDAEPADDAPKHAPEPPKPEAKSSEVKPMEDGVQKPAGPTIKLKEWTDEAKKLSPEVATSTQTNDQGPKRPPVRPGQSAPESPVFPFLRRCAMLIRIAENPANNGDLSATSWVDEVQKGGEHDSAVVARLITEKMLAVEGDPPYCYLTEAGVAEYKSVKSALDQYKAELQIVEFRPSAAKPEPKATPVGKNAIFVSQLAPGDTFVFEPGGHVTGRVIRKNTGEVKVRYYHDGKEKGIQFISPGTEVFRGGQLPEGLELDPLVGKKESPKAAETPKIESPKPSEVAATPAVKAKVDVESEDEEEDDEEGDYEIETKYGNIPVEVQEPKEEGGKQRIRVFGHSVTAIIRWMGSDAWTLRYAKRALRKLRLDVAESTISSQMASGRNGEGKRGEVPELTAKQEKMLYSLRKKPVAK